MAARGNPRRRGRIRLGPAALDEDRRGDAEAIERLEEALGHALGRRSIGMLGVEGQGNANGPTRPALSAPDVAVGVPGAAVASTGRRHFSTPVMTMPRMNTRWNSMNSTTGITNVSMLPTWMNAGFL